MNINFCKAEILEMTFSSLVIYLTGGEIKRVYNIHELMNQLNAGMHNITFKNDHLRKRYDGLKYNFLLNWHHFNLYNIMHTNNFLY